MKLLTTKSGCNKAKKVYGYMVRMQKCVRGHGHDCSTAVLQSSSGQRLIGS